MADRYEAVAVRKYDQNGEQKTAFTNIGVAFKMRDRDGYSVRLHAMPAPADGEFTILLMPPKPKEDSGRQQNNGGDHSRQGGHSAGSSGAGPDDDGIPFAPPRD